MRKSCGAAFPDCALNPCWKRRSGRCTCNALTSEPGVGSGNGLFRGSLTLDKIRTEGLLQPITIVHCAILPVSLLAAWLPWSRYYYSHYLPFARFSIPIVSALAAPFSAQAVAQGHLEVVTMVALQIVGIFQFSGLLYRSALCTCILVVAGFAVGTVIWSLPPAVAYTYLPIMGLATLLGAVESRGSEIITRTQYLEGKLLGELLERDPLTGLKNRRSFDEHLQRIWLQAQRDERAVAVLMVDVDDFKRYNDTYRGHRRATRPCVA